MGLTKSLIERSHSINYLESPILISFYNLRESYYYYLSLRLIKSKRDFYEKIKKDAIKFIELINSKEIEDFINTVVFSDVTKISYQGSLESSLIDLLRNEDEEGYKLLELSEPVTIDSLKENYRSAAKKHHPDKGGSTENMKIVNNAFEKYHKLLCLYNYREMEIDLNNDFEIRSVSDFVCALYKIIIDITLDNWDIEETYAWILKYLNLDSKPEENKFIQIDLIPTLTSLAKKLFVANFKDEANYCLLKAEKYLLVAKNEELFFDNYVLNAKKVLCNSGKYRVIVTHKEQAENLIKYKIIDEKRFKDSLRKFNTTSDEEISKKSNLKQFIDTVGFLKELQSDKHKKYVSIENKLIEEPGYFNYEFIELNNEQKTEYKKAFSIKTDIQLIRKYTYVRLHSLLKSIITFKQFDIIENAILEIELIKELKSSRSRVDFDCDKIIDLFKYFLTLSTNDLSERINLLSELDIRSLELFESNTNCLTFINSFDNIFKIQLNEKYYDLAKIPILELKNCLITGKIEENKDERKKRELYDSELEKIEKITQKHGGMKLFKIFDESKNNPEYVIKILKPYLDDLLELGDNILNVAELQLIYWVNHLTIAYVRLKSYKASVELLERIFKLPEDYWDRSCNSEKNALKKRYEKCLKKIRIN